jgi:hypothetical protein
MLSSSAASLSHVPALAESGRTAHRAPACRRSQRQLRFRGLISTSNIIEGSEVDVTANEDLIWITEFREDTRGTPSGSGGGTGSGTGHGEPISSSGAYA